MAETVKELEIAGTVYPIEDATAREGLETLQQDVEKGLSALQEYSTTEQNTGKKWIDNKPIYRRCFSFNLPAVGTTTEVATGFAVDFVDTVTRFDTVMKNPVGGVNTIWWTPEYVASGNTVNVYLSRGGTSFSVSNAIWPATSIVSITLEYTKVAD